MVRVLHDGTHEVLETSACADELGLTGVELAAAGLIGEEDLIELTESTDPGVREILSYQKNEANNEFAKFVRANYLSWFSDRDADAPVLSHQLVRSKVFPIVDASAKTTLFLIDNFRLDQWRMIRPVLHGLFDVEQEDFYCSILPDAASN